MAYQNFAKHMERKFENPNFTFKGTDAVIFSAPLV